MIVYHKKKQAEGIINRTASIIRGCPADDKSTTSSSATEGCSPVVGDGNFLICFERMRDSTVKLTYQLIF